ncbi:hypothetical protein SV7mr_20000 [Stieleria bergensis]|uniref:Uncharacterized protein n=1 Tax=Stieleria bergensis TaxID=2528025 RepID=A0A517STU4_9BACT|nr:hypothetical protein SV7mr_20000 [Planctomycetes bacterium SV_7m_r]
MTDIDRVNDEENERKINELFFQERVDALLKKFPDTPVLERWPLRARTARWWRRCESRKPKKDAKPSAIIRHQYEFTSRTPHQNLQTGKRWETTEIEQRWRPVCVYDYESTREFKKHARTIATEQFWDFFCHFSSEDYRVAYTDDGASSWCGKIKEDEVRDHINGKRDFARRASEKTRSITIDHDLHGGCRNVFMKQLEILLDDFWGTEAWHIQAKQKNANGVHFINVWQNPFDTNKAIAGLRQRLISLDEKYPELAKEAESKDMHSFASMEILPTKGNGMRLPLASSRTMLIDQPLQQVTYRKREVQDVVGYMNWVLAAVKGQASVMPKGEVQAWIEKALKQREKEERNLSSILHPHQSTPSPEKPVSNKAAAPKTGKQKQKRKADFKGMKGKSWKQITQALSGEMQADSIDHWINQLALYTPFKFATPDEAVACIEKFVDELPDQSVSDRLTSGKRARVSANIRICVKNAFNGWTGQPRPEETKKKLTAVWKRFQLTGRDLFDKSTWGKSGSAYEVKLAPDFEWTEEELGQLTQLANLLRTNITNCDEAVRHLIRLIRVHSEVSKDKIKSILETAGIKCGSKRDDKPKAIKNWLIGAKWIYAEAAYVPKVRCYRYGLGKTMRIKFPPLEADDKVFAGEGESLEELTARFEKEKSSLFSAEPVGVIN